MTDTQLLDAAHRYARAYVAMANAESANINTAALELDEATHELVVLAGEPCPMCDPGTCLIPRGQIDTPPL